MLTQGLMKAAVSRGMDILARCQAIENSTEIVFAGGQGHVWEKHNDFEGNREKKVA